MAPRPRCTTCCRSSAKENAHVSAFGCFLIPAGRSSGSVRVPVRARADHSLHLLSTDRFNWLEGHPAVHIGMTIRRCHDDRDRHRVRRTSWAGAALRPPTGHARVGRDACGTASTGLAGGRGRTLNAENSPWRCSILNEDIACAGARSSAGTCSTSGSGRSTSASSA